MNTHTYNFLKLKLLQLQDNFKEPRLEFANELFELAEMIQENPSLNITFKENNIYSIFTDAMILEENGMFLKENILKEFEEIYRNNL